MLLLEGDGGFLPLTTGEGRRDERVVGRLLLLLRERDVLLLAHTVAILVRISLLLLLLLVLLPLRLRRRGLVQTVLFALLLLEREHAVGGFALDLLLYEDLVLDRAVQLGEIGLLSVLELGEGVGRLGRRLEARPEVLRLLLLLWDASIRCLAHVGQRCRVERWRMLLVVVVVGTCPECERFRAMPRRSVVARHSDVLWNGGSAWLSNEKLSSRARRERGLEVTHASDSNEHGCRDGASERRAYSSSYLA